MLEGLAKNGHSFYLTTNLFALNVEKMHCQGLQSTIPRLNFPVPFCAEVPRRVSATHYRWTI